MESSVLFALILFATTFATVAPAQTIQASENPLPVGSNVTLFSLQGNVTLGTWIFDNNLIVLIVPGKPLITTTSTGRVTFNSTFSSLTIRSVQLEDSGLYTLQGVEFRSQITLSVQVPISNVTLRANATNLVEFNDTAVLTCSVLTGSSLSYVWLNGSDVVTLGAGVQLSDGNATLTMSRVNRNDAGPYRCNVSNGVSHESSLPVYLNISYGPSNITMVIMPIRSTYITGSNITLSCSAESSPPAMIYWMVDRVNLNQFGSHLQLERVTEGESGNYQCVFHNTVTSRFSSKGAMIRIMEPIAAVVVKYTGGPVIVHEPLSLSCEVTGSVDRIQWWRNHQLITADNTTFFDMNNKTLNITHVQLSQDGYYQCQAFNSVSNMTSSPYTVDIYYGPQMPTIKGPNAAKTGDNATFYCIASSNPPGSYTWIFNNSVMANMSHYNYYATPPLTKDMSGKYTCIVFNNITRKNSTAYKMLTVFDLQVETPMHPAIEGHFYMLTCNMSGPAENVYWKKNGKPLHEDNTTDYLFNKTIIFNPLKQSDTGLYQCMAVNPLWNMTSPPYMLLVNFGPESPMIDGPAFAEAGHYAVFNCSATSMPTSRFTWWFNGSYAGNSSVFRTGILSLNMSGVITCKAYNDVTGKNVSKSKMFTVIEASGPVMIRSNTIPINSENFTLTCDVTGPYDMIYWMKNDMLLNVSEPHMSYANENNTLHFTPVTLYNEGMYQCVATNQAGAQKSPKYILLVNYGPLKMEISGPDSTQGDVSVSLKCSALSRPYCEFHWFFNMSSVALKTGPLITFLSTKENEGTYTCKATNPVTNITMYQTKTFTVAAHASALHFSSQGGLMMMGLFALFVPVLFN